MSSRRTGVDEQTSALMKNKKFLNGEIDQLRQKSAALAKGFEATRQEFDLIANLVKKGLSANSRQLELQQNLAQLQSNQLDVEVAIVRANEDIARTDRDLAEIVSKSRNDLMLEAQDVRVKLSETIEKIETARQLVRQAEVHAPSMLQSRLSAAAHPNYRIARVRGDGKVSEEPALETDAVKPGDVVRVIINSDEGSPARTSAGQASAEGLTDDLARAGPLGAAPALAAAARPHASLHDAGRQCADVADHVAGRRRQPAAGDRVLRRDGDEDRPDARQSDARRRTPRSICAAPAC